MQKSGVLIPDANPEFVNFDEVRKNASEQGIDLASIAIVYKDLNQDEIDVLKQLDLITHENGGNIIARFCKNGDVCFPKKAVSVFSLSA